MKSETRNSKFETNSKFEESTSLNCAGSDSMISPMKLIRVPTIFLTIVTLGFTPTKSFAADQNSEKGVPKIQFETSFVDLGTLTAMESISGSSKFRNAGGDVLKLDPPQASCDCTEPRVKPDIVAPGETGEVSYTIKLERPLT